MKVLIGCEVSGVIRDAFRDRGHDAWSCDLDGPDQFPALFRAQAWPAYHLEGDVRWFLDGAPGGAGAWDLFIAHPECRYLCASGLHWNKRRPERVPLMEQAAEFALELWNADIPKVCLENPPGILSTRIRKPDQIIQPNQFGEDASKATALWLRGLSPLKRTRFVEPRMVCGVCKWHMTYHDFGNGCVKCGADAAAFRPRWSNQTDSGQNRLGPSPTRSAERARTYAGIAQAMAEQWGAQ